MALCDGCLLGGMQKTGTGARLDQAINVLKDGFGDSTMSKACS